MAQADLHIDASTPGEIARSPTPHRRLRSDGYRRWCNVRAGRQSDKAGSGLLGELRQDRVAAVDRRAALAFIATAL
jgi:hypothetical protein